MAVYKYVVKGKNGEVANGIFDAESLDKVTNILHDKDYLIMDIKELKRINTKSLIYLWKISAKELALFSRQFHTMLNSGINIVECLSILKNQVGDKRLSDAIAKMEESVQVGSLLSNAIGQHPNVFPNIMVAMVEVGEASGKLSESMKRLAEYFEKENRIKQKVQSALAYPAVISAMAVLVIVFMMIFVVPKFMEFFISNGTQLPLPTRILLAISGANFIVYLLAVLAIVVLVVLFKKLISTEKGGYSFDKALIGLPVIGELNRKIIAFRMTQTLSGLLYAGVPLVRTLEICTRVIGNKVIAKKMGKVIESVVLGSALAGTFEGMKIFPFMVIRMIKVGEEAGTLDEMMGKVSEFYEEEIEATISKVVVIVEPLLITVLAIVVGLIAISMIMPLFTMYEFYGQ